MTVLPVFVTLQMTETRRFSTFRWFLLSSAAVLAGLGCAFLLHRHTDLSVWVAGLPVVLSWAAPAVVWLLEPGQDRVGGRAGLHE